MELNTLIKQKEKAFDEKFDKPISDHAHRHLNSPTSRNVYYDNRELKSFLSTSLREVAEKTLEAVKMEEKDNVPTEGLGDEARVRVMARELGYLACRDEITRRGKEFIGDNEKSV